jgi:4'-phosphopantetheinyl transferase
MKILIANTQSIILENSIQQLPISLRARATTYRNPQAAINYCVGRLLLQKAALDLGFEASIVEKIEYSAQKKPFLNEFCFNISHSGAYVALAYSFDMPMGLDIECPQDIHLPHFQASFREDEWEDIMKHTDPKARFYWYWVRKEAILKAADMSLSILKRIRILSDALGDTGEGTQKWHLQALDIGENCCGVVAVGM